MGGVVSMVPLRSVLFVSQQVHVDLTGHVGDGKPFAVRPVLLFEAPARAEGRSGERHGRQWACFSMPGYSRIGLRLDSSLEQEMHRAI